MYVIVHMLVPTTGQSAWIDVPVQTAVIINYLEMLATLRAYLAR